MFVLLFFFYEILLLFIYILIELHFNTSKNGAHNRKTYHILSIRELVKSRQLTKKLPQLFHLPPKLHAVNSPHCLESSKGNKTLMPFAFRIVPARYQELLCLPSWSCGLWITGLAGLGLFASSQGSLLAPVESSDYEFENFFPSKCNTRMLETLA